MVDLVYLNFLAYAYTNDSVGVSICMNHIVMRVEQLNIAIKLVALLQRKIRMFRFSVQQTECQTEK